MQDMSAMRSQYIQCSRGKEMKTGRPVEEKWTSEQRVKFIEMTLRGEMTILIAREFNICAKTVKRVRIRLTGLVHAVKPKQIPSSRKKPQQNLSQQKMRTCLTCQREFHSWGPGNRVCPDCLGLSIFQLDRQMACR